MSPTSTARLCQRNVKGAPCSAGVDGTPAPASEQVDGRWYCKPHIGAARAVARKRLDRGFGTCAVSGCTRPAAEKSGKCSEHRAAERASGASVLVVEDGSGRGEHPYAPKLTLIYLVLFRELGLLKVGKATPWTVRSRVRAATANARNRINGSSKQGVSGDWVAWTIELFVGENVLWAISERVEHAAAGRLAHNVSADSVEYTEGKEWLRHDAIADIDWQAEFHSAVCETLAFFGHDLAQAGEARSLT